MSKTKPY